MYPYSWVFLFLPKRIEIPIRRKKNTGNRVFWYNVSYEYNTTHKKL